MDTLLKTTSRLVRHNNNASKMLKHITIPLFANPSMTNASEMLNTVSLRGRKQCTILAIEVMQGIA